ncbi:hypothetical protein ACW73L_19710 [Methylolobus aquaticus]
MHARLPPTAETLDALEDFHERAAILEHDHGLTRGAAEREALSRTLGRYASGTTLGAALSGDDRNVIRSRLLAELTERVALVRAPDDGV